MAYIDPYRDALGALARSLAALPHGQRRSHIERAAPLLGKSVATVYRDLKAMVGYDSGRKQRSDKGTSKCSIAQARLIAAFAKVGTRDNAKETISTPQGLYLLGQTPLASQVSVATANRVLRREKLNAKARRIPAPHVELRSLHPNHVHQVDPSLCLVYYLRGKQHVMAADKFYKNKMDAYAKVKLKVWRYVLTDHASGSIVVRYFESAGEDQRTLFQFLMWAWQQQEGRTVYGVPKLLMMDPGSANTAKSIENLCESLDTVLQINEPGQPRAKGSVENAQNIVERHFESLLKIQPVETVEELNEAALAWQEAFNGDLIDGRECRLKRDGFSVPRVRMDLWLTIKSEQLRICPPTMICAQLMNGKIETRTVNGKLRIGFKHPQAAYTMYYNVRGIDGVCAGDKLQVQPMLYGRGVLLVKVQTATGDIVSHRLNPIEDFNEYGVSNSSPVIGQEYHSLPTTPAERSNAELDRLAYGIDADGVVRTDEEIEAAKKKRVTPFAYMDLKPLDSLKRIAKRTNLPKRGTAIEPHIDEVAPLRTDWMEKEGLSINVPDVMNAPATRLDHIEIAQRVISIIGSLWTPDKFALLQQLYPDGCSEEELPAVAEDIRRRSRMQIITGGAA